MLSCVCVDSDQLLLSLAFLLVYQYTWNAIDIKPIDDVWNQFWGKKSIYFLIILYIVITFKKPSSLWLWSLNCPCLDDHPGGGGWGGVAGCCGLPPQPRHETVRLCSRISSRQWIYFFHNEWLTLPVRVPAPVLISKFSDTTKALMDVMSKQATADSASALRWVSTLLRLQFLSCGHVTCERLFTPEVDLAFYRVIDQI